MDIIQTELLKKNKSEFYNNGEYTGNNKKFQFIQKALRYDEDVQEIVNDMFFMGYTFPNPEADKYIKKMFVNRFLNRQIGRQTVEDFASQVVYTSLSNEQEMMILFENYEDFIISNNSVTSESINEGINESIYQNRDLRSTLPQDQINLDLNSFDMDYGDENNIAKSLDKSNNNNKQTTKTDSKNYNAGNLKAFRGAWDYYFKEYDRRCFLQVW